jgi:hypothetical protein
MRLGDLKFTPERHWPVTIFAIALILSQPLFTVAHYGWNQQMGAYPVNADSIGIPISQDLIAWVLFTPVALLGIWWVLSKYSGPVSHLAWNWDRPFWSVFWSLLFGLLLFCVLTEVPFDVRWLNPFSLLNDGLWFLLFSQLRALMVMKRGWV